jgi:hypothetical protein
MLSPARRVCVDFAPFVIELWAIKNIGQAAKSLLYFPKCARTEIKNDNHGAMNERKSPVIQKIPITGYEYQPIAKGVGQVILIRMPSFSRFLHGQNPGAPVA